MEIIASNKNVLTIKSTNVNISKTKLHLQHNPIPNTIMDIKKFIGNELNPILLVHFDITDVSRIYTNIFYDTAKKIVESNLNYQYELLAKYYVDKKRIESEIENLHLSFKPSMIDLGKLYYEKETLILPSITFLDPNYYTNHIASKCEIK